MRLVVCAKAMLVILPRLDVVAAYGEHNPKAVPVSLAGVRHSSTGHLPCPSAVRTISLLRTRAVAAKDRGFLPYRFTMDTVREQLA